MHVCKHISVWHSFSVSTDIFAEPLSHRQLWCTLGGKTLTLNIMTRQQFKCVIVPQPTDEDYFSYTHPHHFQQEAPNLVKVKGVGLMVTVSTRTEN